MGVPEGTQNNSAMRWMMRRLLVLTLGSVFLFAGAVQAAPLKYHGTAISLLGTLPSLVFTGSGIATVNGSTGYGHLNQFIALDDIVGTQTAVVTDPEVTIDGIISIRATLVGGGGLVGNISGGGPLNPNQIPSQGISKVCLYDPNCLPGGFLPLILSQHKAGSTTVGIGQGGLLTIGGAGMIRISLLANPYTIGMVSAIDQTDNGGFETLKTTGFVHGPASLTSSTAKPSGVVQFVSPTQVSTNLTVGSSDLISLFNVLRIHFIPEPGMLLLIGSGVAGLILLGRKRMGR